MEVSGYHAFDEGMHFYALLDAFSQYVRSAGLVESHIEHMLVCVSPTETHIYANDELPLIARMRPKRSVKAGEAVLRDDIAGIDRVEFPGVSPPAACGFLLLVSVGWRRGMCFDLEPLAGDSRVTSQEAFARLKRMAGMVLTHLHFTERFLLSNRDWGKVFTAGWFPFIFLSQGLWNCLFASIRNGWDLSQDEQKIHDSWLGSCDDRLVCWRANRHFEHHMEFFERAIDAYKKDDWLTVVSVATPRVEGLLRLAFGAWGKLDKAIDKLAENVKRQEHAKSLLFPDRLRLYFEKIFYRFTKFSLQGLPVTRHTVSHGVVSADKITRKEALTLLLLIDHVHYCMPLESDVKDIPHSP